MLKLLLILTLLAPLKTIAGTEGGGGGNTAVAEFIEISNAIGTAFQYEEYTSFGLSGKDLNMFLITVKVEGVAGPLYLKGVRVEAINYPHLKLIKLDTNAWSKLSQRKKTLLVIHELLGLRYALDYRYETSLSILKDLERVQANESEILKVNPVQCSIHDMRPNSKAKTIPTFKLEPYGSGVFKQYKYDNDFEFLIYISYGPRRDVNVEIKNLSIKNGSNLSALVSTKSEGEFSELSINIQEFWVECKMLENRFLIKE